MGNLEIFTSLSFVPYIKGGIKGHVKAHFLSRTETTEIYLGSTNIFLTLLQSID